MVAGIHAALRDAAAAGDFSKVKPLLAGVAVAGAATAFLKYQAYSSGLLNGGIVVGIALDLGELVAGALALSKA